MHEFITGIQQAGIGVSDCNKAKYLYKDLFGMNILIFDDTASAELMKQYTGNEVHNRRAILTMNLSGGGGFELWQFINRNPKPYYAQFGDLGIFAIKMKCSDVNKAHKHFKDQPNVFTSELHPSPPGGYYFWVRDTDGNFFAVAESNSWFKKDKCLNGGVYGAVIGVSDMDASINFYKNFLGIEEVLYDATSVFADVPGNTGEKFRRVILRKKKGTSGAFSNLLGDVEIELVQCMNKKTKKIFENRYWGDSGFIHLCFDVTNMDGLKIFSEKLGYKFTIDSNNSYAMETAEGRFCYVEDPDGTLIELVETHKIPIIKKLNWHIDLRKRKQQKPLPNWMINMLGLNKVK
ncbi:MAG: VOC family protein [Bacteroidota bacterium]|nr:VOC family protein [Bacteroidota bacterium]